MTLNNNTNPQDIRLLAHNRMAYNAVKECFKNHNRAAVVHATGSGKSFIIARTAQDFSKVLVIAPNDFVLNETRKICPPRCQFLTYTAVMFMEEPVTGLDLIVLDEFHRAGAEKWGEGVQMLLEANPNAKVLGTSATDIRYLDNMRNMADELFDGQVVSRISLKSAIDLGILPNPTYVSSLYELDTTIDAAAEHILKSGQTPQEKAAALKHLKGIQHSWQEAHGVPAVIKKYFSKEMKRVIVFCTDIRMAHSCRSTLEKWFNRAGFPCIHFYDINCRNKNLQHEMYEFQQDVPGLQVALSVNMLNEGVHIPKVDAIIMLRSTMSRIIIEQQIGRCLTAKNTTTNPVILDLVNNMDGLNNLGIVYLANGEIIPTGISREPSADNDPFPFRVIDEAADIRDLMSEIYGKFHLALDNPNISRSKEDCAAIAAEYKSIAQFRKEQKRIYNYIIFHHWQDELFSHMERRHFQQHTKEECAKVAKKYTTRSGFLKGDRTIYDYAKRHGWIDEITAHCTPYRPTFSKEECVTIAKQYTSLRAFYEGSPKVYNFAKRNGFLKEISTHMKKCTKWTKELVKIEAAKYGSRSAFQFGNQSAYNYAKRHGLIKELYPADNMSATQFKRKQWTKEEVLALAAQTPNRSTFRAKHYSALMFATRNGFDNELKYNK